MAKSLGVDYTENLELRNIFASGNHPYLQEEVTIASPNGALTAGTVLHASAGKAVKWDNSTDVIGVLAEDIDATAGDVKGIVVYGGPFNRNALDATTTPVALGVLPGNHLVQVVEEF